MKKNKAAQNVYQCSGCRQQKVIVLNVLGMSYGECCQHKAPTKFQYNEFKHMHSNSSGFPVDTNRRINKRGNRG